MSESGKNEEKKSMMENTRNKGTASIAYEASPPWPANNKIWWDIVHTHNKLVDAGKFTAEELNGSKSITLVMICAAMGKAIPMKYRLDTKRAKGIADHPTYVKDYAVAVCSGVPHTEKGKIIVKPVKRFAEDLGVPVRAVCEGLVKALNTGRVDRIPSPTDDSPHMPTPSIPQKTDVDFALSQLRTSPHEEIGINAVLDQVESNFNANGKLLKENWRNITQRNIINNWFSTKG